MRCNSEKNIDGALGERKGPRAIKPLWSPQIEAQKEGGKGGGRLAFSDKSGRFEGKGRYPGEG